MSDEPVNQLEADFAEIARTLPRPRGLPAVRTDNVVPIGASAVSKRLEDLLAQAQDLSKRTEALAVALAGPALPEAHGLKVAGGRKEAETLFTKQLGGLDDLGQVLDTLGRALERAHRSLA